MEELTQWMIGRSALIGAVLAVVVLMPWRTKQWLEEGVLGVIVGLSILVWRAGANVDILNSDPVPAVSPNDLACPVFSYVCLQVYAGIRGQGEPATWARDRALLTLVSLLVNVVTI